MVRRSISHDVDKSELFMRPGSRVPGARSTRLRSTAEKRLAEMRPPQRLVVRRRPPRLTPNETACVEQVRPKTEHAPRHQTARQEDVVPIALDVARKILPSVLQLSHAAIVQPESSILVPTLTPSRGQGRVHGVPDGYFENRYIGKQSSADISIPHIQRSRAGRITRCCGQICAHSIRGHGLVESLFQPSKACGFKDDRILDGLSHTCYLRTQKSPEFASLASSHDATGVLSFHG